MLQSRLWRLRLLLLVFLPLLCRPLLLGRCTAPPRRSYSTSLDCKGKKRKKKGSERGDRSEGRARLRKRENVENGAGGARRDVASGSGEAKRVKKRPPWASGGDGGDGSDDFLSASGRGRRKGGLNINAPFKLVFDGSYSGQEGPLRGARAGPKEGVPQVAFIGRSNAGKSTLINQLGRAGGGGGDEARVGKTPGVTDRVK